ncbi:hypothetical protein K493DRAFT_108589 [Basidiobolus meristosporus CBS 931.73]|uniref:Uncharacterized protein n=1 Tax=Basidiobolus meristosporus CBS 931.73 TaxID=1314790 RepID=A0A1Y1YP18_9FUNG|nr:hypothetical protein K493DRAFT_108589 [Basidiobolus meristosporus CBS 931.73]|eukprot:ORX99751.1 hypothetical protein K493DRAFT_108589 [Basidiobolus meristosporus CBS 931.73]
MNDTTSLFTQVSTNFVGFPAIEWGPYFPVPIVATLHAARVAYDLRKSLPKEEQIPWFQALFTFYTLSFGGTTTSAILLAIPPGWLASNTMLPLYTLIYMAIFKSPFDIVYRLLTLLGPITELVLNAGDCVSRTFAITNMGVEAVRLNGLSNVSNSYVGMLICGTLSGCGGGIFSDAFQLTQRNWAFRTPTVFTNPGFDIKLCFSVASVYVLTTSPAEWAKYLVLIGLDESWIPQLTIHEAKTVCWSMLLGTMLYRKFFASAPAAPKTQKKAKKAQ